MDKNAIKKFAVWARREMISRVSQRAALYEITKDGFGDANADSVLGRVMSSEEKRQRQALIVQIREKGYEQVMEEIAYTWFNRFIALRFMEVNGYLPSRVRIFTDDENTFKPQILNEAINIELDGLDIQKVFELKNANDDDALFKYMIIVQCNALSEILPGMFQKISDYTELLFPDNLLREGSVVEQMIVMIPQEDWTDQVQIIGWLYQYYNTEPKDKVFADLKKNIKISKENIPAATQLFTPDWIVRYMVENSLGRLWLEGHPNDELKASWKYYLDEVEQEAEVQAQLDTIHKEFTALKPEEIRVIDPCMGSGHILAYMFDVLVQIYEAYGYTAREAAASIVERNIWGLDIDERAAQLAYFSVMMKARQYDRRFFSRGIQPHVFEIVESNSIDHHAIEYFVNNNKTLRNSIELILDVLYDAKQYGSVLNVPNLDYTVLYARFEEIRDEISVYQISIFEELFPLVKVSETLSQKYHVMVTNPPYMVSSNMNQNLNGFIRKYYSDYKNDFFSAFIVRGSEMTRKDGYCSFFSPYVWMFIQSYEKLRQYLYSECTIETLIQFEYSAFEEATVPVCTFTFRNRYIVGKKGCYLRLTAFRGGMEIQRQKTMEAIENHGCNYYFEQTTDNFSKIPGKPVAYWVSEKELQTFNGLTVGDVMRQKMRINTGDNEKYLRKWYEVCFLDLFRPNRWIPFSKGGDYRKWYGNWEYVLDYLDNGAGFKSCPGYRGSDERNFFLEGIVWTDLSSAKPSFRFFPKDCIASAAGPMIGIEDQSFDLLCVLAFLNSKVVLRYTEFLCPTIHFQWGDIAKLPVKLMNNSRVSALVEDNISLARDDWDSFETSWDFKFHPLLSKQYKNQQKQNNDGSFFETNTLQEAYKTWEQVSNIRFDKLKANEEELNNIFINNYGLQSEILPEVEEKDISVRKADVKREVRSLISYAVGCMFGRYSLDVSGLVFAGGTWTDSRYEKYQPDKDGIIPICDDEYFNDDIVSRFVQFVEVVYGKETLEENLSFIAYALGGKGSAREVIRNYFINDFYSDHLKVYQKRPIYWLFDSGKNNGFKCLIYMHRYQPDTIARIRTDYVHEQQSRYRTAISDLESQIANAETGERVKLSKQLTKLQEQAEEVRVYEEKIHHLADQMIRIDLDDGVKVNYAKFQDVLAKIK